MSDDVVILDEINPHIGDVLDQPVVPLLRTRLYCNGWWPVSWIWSMLSFPPGCFLAVAADSKASSRDSSLPFEPPEQNVTCAT